MATKVHMCVSRAASSGTVLLTGGDFCSSGDSSLFSQLGCLLGKMNDSGDCPALCRKASSHNTEYQAPQVSSAKAEKLCHRISDLTTKLDMSFISQLLGSVLERFLSTRSLAHWEPSWHEYLPNKLLSNVNHLLSFQFSLLKRFPYFYLMHIDGLPAPMCICTPQACLVFPKVRKGDQIPWNCSYRLLLVASQMLGI